MGTPYSATNAPGSLAPNEDREDNPGSANTLDDSFPPAYSEAVVIQVSPLGPCPTKEPPPERAESTEIPSKDGGQIKQEADSAPPSYFELNPHYRSQYAGPGTDLAAALSFTPETAQMSHLQAVFESRDTFIFLCDQRIYDSSVSPILGAPIEMNYPIRDLYGNTILRIIEDGSIYTLGIKLGFIDPAIRDNVGIEGMVICGSYPSVLNHVVVEKDSDGGGLIFKSKMRTYGRLERGSHPYNKFVLTFPPSVQDVAAKALILAATRVIVDFEWMQGIYKPDSDSCLSLENIGSALPTLVLLVVAVIGVILLFKYTNVEILLCYMFSFLPPGKC